MDNNDRLRSFGQFLSTQPVGSIIELDTFPSEDRGSIKTYVVPPILNECPGELCGDKIIYDPTSTWYVSEKFSFLSYKCRHCGATTITYAVMKEIVHEGEKLIFRVKKIGQEPRFRVKIPSSVLRELSNQDDREMLRRASELEQQNFGIGAFVYYRRVVESQKCTLIDMIIQVMRLEGVGDVMISQIESEKAKISFSESVDNIKDVIPKSLYMFGHNPMTVLHKALSLGVHQYDEAKCLENAAAIRNVICTMVSRIRELTKNQADLKESIGKLLKG